MKYTRITKQVARRMFAEGKTFFLCPCRMLPCNMWGMTMSINAARHLEENNSFDSMLNNWAYYNANSETGYYAHYYRQD